MWLLELRCSSTLESHDPVDPVLKRYSDLNDALREYW
jgi:hypothetical protein